MKKKGIIIAIIVVGIIAVIIGIGLFRKTDNEESTPDENTTNTADIVYKDMPLILKPKILAGLNVTNIAITKEGKTTKFTADIQNVTGEDAEAKEITIAFKNADGTDYAGIKTQIQSMKKGESSKIELTTEEDILKASNFVFE